MSFTISLEELLERQSLHEHCAEEWKNKMTYDEYRVFEKEAFVLARQLFKDGDFESFDRAFFSILKERGYLYSMAKDARNSQV